MDNQFVPKYIPSDLKWYERDGLDTWYLEGKCKYFLAGTDGHFKRTKIVNFDIINNTVSKEKLKQYQQIDHQMVMLYLPKERDEIFSSVFRNIERDGMNVTKEAVNEHFKNKKPSIGRGRFMKKIRDSVYAKEW